MDFGCVLLKVPKELLKSIESGEDFTICGSETEEVVLCTKSQTFSVKRVEQSNSGKYRSLSGVVMV